MSIINMMFLIMLIIIVSVYSLPEVLQDYKRKKFKKQYKPENVYFSFMVACILMVLHWMTHSSEVHKKQDISRRKLKCSHKIFLHRLSTNFSGKNGKENACIISHKGNSSFRFGQCKWLKDKNWMYHWFCSGHSYFIYPVFRLLASFRSLLDYGENQTSCSFIELSEAGFGNTGVGGVVRCSECGKTLEISSITAKADTPRYHQPGCKFARTERNITDLAATSSNNNIQENLGGEAVGQDGGFYADERTSIRAAHQIPGAMLDECDGTLSSQQSRREMSSLLGESADQTAYISDHEDQSSVNARSSVENFPETEPERSPTSFSCPREVTREQLPNIIRYPQALRFLQLISLLTVRVVRMDESTSHGTGNCFTYPCRMQTHGEVKQNSRKHNLFRKKNNITPKVHEIYIETSSDIVQNDSDAGRTTVEFFCDNQGERMVRIEGGKEMTQSRTPRDKSRIIVYNTTDLELVGKLNSYRAELIMLAQNMPHNILQAFTSKIFIIGYRRDGRKVLSLENSVVLKYLLRFKIISCGAVNDINQPRVTVYDIGQVSDQGHNLTQNLALRTAEAWQELTGAPVFTLKLNLWMYHRFEQVWLRRSVGNRSASLSVPVQHKQYQGDVLLHAQYSWYSAYQDRLESFASWSYDHIQSKEHLAHAGFFYTGSADCVQCFYCGLGLTRWKPGVVALVEHNWHSPNCLYISDHDISLQADIQYGREDNGSQELVGATGGEESVNGDDDYMILE